MNGIKIGKDMVGITFSYPYTVFVTDDLWDELGLKEDIVQMHFGDRMIVAKTKLLNEFDFKKDVHGIFYAIFHNFTMIPPELRGVIKSHISGRTLLTDTPEQLGSFIDKIYQFLKQNFWDDKKILIGCGFFEIFLKGTRELGSMVNTPLFQIDKPTFDTLIKGNYQSPDKISKYKGKIVTPEKVYFCSERHLLSDIWKDKAIEEIKEQEIFIPGGDYLIPSPITIHGPLIYHHPSNGEEEIVYKINKPESVEFLASALGSIKPTLKMDILYKILEGLAKEYGFNIEQVPDRVRLEKGNELLFFTPFESEILFQPTHILDERKGIVTSLVQKFLRKAEKLTGKKFEFSEPIYYELMPEVRSRKWVLDTCVIYLHENVKSILNFIIPGPFFYQSSFIVPEAVLYEINRKKDEKPSLCTKGINNLELLKILADTGFIELDFPKSEFTFLSSQGQIMKESSENIKFRLPSAVIDFIILRHVDEEITFITKDKVLEKLAGIMGKKVLNVENYIVPEYQDIEIYELCRKEFKEIVYQKIDSQKRVTFNDLVGSIEDFLKVTEAGEEFTDKNKEKKRRDEETKRRRRAKNIVNKIARGGDIIKVPMEDGLMWKKSSIKEVVLDSDVVEEIQLYLKKENGNFYFTPDFLEKVRKKSGLAKDVMPTLEVALPKTLITYAYRNKKNRIIKGIEIIKAVKNAMFKWVEIPQIAELSEGLLKESLFRLCEEGNRILISKNEEIGRIARLRDIRCIKV